MLSQHHYICFFVGALIIIWTSFIRGMKRLSWLLNLILLNHYLCHSLALLPREWFLAPWYENDYLTVFLYPISVWGCLKVYCKGETLHSVCVRETELCFHTHVAEKAAFSITCCLGAGAAVTHGGLLPQAPLCQWRGSVPSYLADALELHSRSWCVKRRQKCEVWKWMANHNSFIECISLQMQ